MKENLENLQKIRKIGKTNEYLEFPDKLYPFTSFIIKLPSNPSRINIR